MKGRSTVQRARSNWKLILSPVLLYLVLGTLHLGHCIHIPGVFARIVNPGVVGCYMLLAIGHAIHHRAQSPAYSATAPTRNLNRR